MFGLGKNNAAIDAFADELVGELTTRFPPAKEELLGGSQPKPARSLGKAAASLIDHRFSDFVANRKLGVYGKARLLNRIKWQMKEGGYSEGFVDVTLAELTRVIARAGAPAAK